MARYQLCIISIIIANKAGIDIEHKQKSYYVHLDSM